MSDLEIIDEAVKIYFDMNVTAKEAIELAKSILKESETNDL